jgi:TolB-like protein/DNA-binding winged helix-turn-helix (wHTH) protein/Tfp pilus assembly protein PilF
MAGFGVECWSALGARIVSDSVKSPGPIRLGSDLELDVGGYELRRAGRRLKLERIPMELLLLLVEQRGQLVTRDQIVERVWGKHVHLATDSSINAAVRKVRQALRDDPDEPRFVQTISGKGYRFIAPVVEVEAKAPPQRDSEEEASVAPPVPAESLFPKAARDVQTRRLAVRWRWAAILGITCVLAAAVSIYLLQSRSRASSPPPPAGRLMLAVLPFENLTGDAGQDYFSDGLTEEMISQLGSLDPQHLGVIARTSVMYYKNRPQQLQQVGRELGVQYVLEGSVRRDSSRVRITAQLILIKDQSHLWAQQYDRELKDLLALQGEIARQISHEIEATLGDHGSVRVPTQDRSSPSYEAFDLYLKGQYFLNKRTMEGFQRAIEYFQQAIAKDPSYARAYASLADSYALISGYSAAPPGQFMPKARAAALQALKLDDSLAEAHTAYALIVQNYDYDWQTSDREFRRAIELNPNYATAHHWYAEHLSWMGRFDEALAESHRALQLDPFSLIIACDNGAILYNARQYDRAIEQFRAVRELDPNFARTSLIVHSYEQKGMFAEALVDLAGTSPPWSGSPYGAAELAYIYGRTGQLEKAQLWLTKLEAMNRRHPLDPAVFVRPNIGMGNKEQALVWLERAYAQHANSMMLLKVDPVYDPLRDEPRFQSLLRRMGFSS